MALNIFDISIEICVIFLIIFTPLAFGCVGFGPQIILISISELIFLLWLIKSVKLGSINYSFSVFSFLFIAFLILMLFQVIPLPKFLLKTLSPAAYNNYIDFLPGYNDFPAWRSISILPEASKIEFFKFLSYGFAAFVIANNFNKEQQILRMLMAISMAGFAIACFGIIQKFTWNGMIYWLQPVIESTGPFGPFVNKNHFAGFMELSIPITAIFVFINKDIGKKALFIFMTVVMLLALFLCLSRAGIISFFAASAFIFSVVFLRRSFKKYVFYVLPAILLVLLFIFFIAKVPLLERFQTMPQAVQGRWQLYSDIIRMFKDFPVFGIGSGSFGKIFSMYKTIPGDITFVHADSDWLQFLSETGLAGFLCIAIFIWLFFKDILYCHFLGKGPCVIARSPEGATEQSPGLRHDKFVLLVISAGLVSITSIILHGFVDINLHIPSNIFLTCIIGSLLMTTAHVKFKEDVVK